MSWTQTTASSNVTLSAILDSNVGVTSAKWYVTEAIGLGTTLSDVVFSGTYSPPPILTLSQFNFNTAPRTVLGTGLDFGAGTYYLVLDGPIGQFINNAEWIGDFTSITTTLAPGFSIGGYSYASNSNEFAPASPFVLTSDNLKFVFELDAVNRAVPEPTSLALLTLGLAGLGFTRRRKRA